MSAVGIIVMLFGAMLAFAPASGATVSQDIPDGLYGVYGDQGQNVNLKCANLDDGTANDYRDDAWDDPSLDFGSLSAVDASYSTVAGTPLRIDWSSGSPVQVVIVKQSTVSAVYFYDGGATSGTVYVVLPDSVNASTGGLSHVSFCGGGQSQEPTGTLVVTKKVDPTPNGDPSFDFTVDGPDEYSDDFALGDGDGSSTQVPVGEYTIAETGGTDGYELSGVACDVNDDPFSPDVTDGAVTVDVPQDGTVTCEFTNVPTPRNPTLTVVKHVVNPPANWDFDFTLCAQQQDEQFAAVRQLEEIPCEFTLGNHDELTTSKTFEGGYFEVTEIDDANLSGIECTDDEGRVGEIVGSTASVELGSSDVTCTFTNEFPRTPPPPQPSCEELQNCPTVPVPVPAAGAGLVDHHQGGQRGRGRHGARHLER